MVVLIFESNVTNFNTDGFNKIAIKDFIDIPYGGNNYVELPDDYTIKVNINKDKKYMGIYILDNTMTIIHSRHRAKITDTNIGIYYPEYNKVLFPNDLLEFNTNSIMFTGNPSTIDNNIGFAKDIIRTVDNKLLSTMSMDDVYWICVNAIAEYTNLSKREVIESSIFQALFQYAKHEIESENRGNDYIIKEIELEADFAVQYNEQFSDKLIEKIDNI